MQNSAGKPQAGGIPKSIPHVIIHDKNATEVFLHIWWFITQQYSKIIIDGPVRDLHSNKSYLSQCIFVLKCIWHFMHFINLIAILLTLVIMFITSVIRHPKPQLLMLCSAKQAI